MSLMSKLVEEFKGTDHAENTQALLEFATRHKVKHPCAIHWKSMGQQENHFKSDFVRGVGQL